MGGQFSYFLPWFKWFAIRRARNKARTSVSASEHVLADCMRQQESDLLLRKAKDHNPNPESARKPDKMLSLQDVSQACKKMEEIENVSTPKDGPMSLPPPPPPPPSLGSSGSNVLSLPPGLVQKEKILVSKKLVNPKWKNVNVRTLSEHSIWMKKEDQTISAHKDYLVENLTTKFPQPDKPNSDSVQKPKKPQMDHKLCLKLRMFKNTTKTMDSKEIVDNILRCDRKFLTSVVLVQLRNLLPPKDDAKNASNDAKNTSNDAKNASNDTFDPFLSPILKISRLRERIDVLLFRLEYEESVNENLGRYLKDIEIVQKACQELKNSHAILKILNLILYIGNVLKSSSDEQLSYGFDVSYLPKLKGMKQENKKLSLLDFLVETISEKFPKVLNFSDEISSVPRASCVSLTDITEWLKQQKCGLQKVETEIEEATTKPTDGDKLKDVLEPFAKKVVKNNCKLEAAIAKMKSDFDEINQYFGYTHDNKEIDPCIEFFGYFRTFQEHFQQSVQSMNVVKRKRN